MKNLMRIPVKKLDEGMRRCEDNIRRFIKDVKLLLQDSSEWHAIAMAIFAYEELAKYSELKKAKSREDKYVDLNGEKYVEIDERLFGKKFGSHKYKQDLAFKLIKDKKSEILLAEADLPPELRNGDVKVSHELRLNCTYINWRCGDWKVGDSYRPDYIRRFKDTILDALNNLVFTTQKSTPK